MTVSPEVLAARILVVDDLESDVRLIEGMLGGAGFCNVSSTRDPRQVCELHRANHYDLIILDLLMPEMDGFAVMDALKHVHAAGYLPVLAVTASDDLMARALERGARDYIDKPLRMGELIARVRNLVSVSLLLKEKHTQAHALEKSLQERTARLWEQAELFRLFAANVPEGLSIRGVDDRIVRYVNPSWHRLTGHSLKVGDGIDEILTTIHPLDRAFVRAEMAKHRAGGMEVEVRFVKPDDGMRWCHIRTFAIADTGGKPLWVAGILEDITARKSLEAQARLQSALVEQSIVAIYVVEEGRFTYANPRMCEMMGYTLEELREFEDLAVLVHPDDRERLAENRRRRAAGDKSALVSNYRLLRRDGTVLHLAVDGRVLEQHGRPVLFGIGQDVSERVRAEALLVEAENHYRALVEQSIVGIYLMSKQRLIYANPRMCEMLGYTLQELGSFVLRDLVLPEDHHLLEDIAARRRAGDMGSIALQCRARRRDGRLLHLAVESKVIELAGHKAAIGVVQDVTERVVAAHRLRESEEKYRLLWETTTDAVILLDDGMTIQYANPSVLQVFGYRPEELVGQSIAILQPERLRRAHAAGVERYLRSGERTLDWRATETVALHRDGRELPVEIAFSHIVAGGKSTFAGFVRDITARTRAQQALQSANERLRELSQRMLQLQEEDRRAISLELHDDIGQSLIALKIGLHRLGADQRGGNAVLLKECMSVADSVRDRVRELATQLHPPQLAQLGLHDALRGLVHRQRDMTGLAIRYSFDGLLQQRLPETVEGACYRICQEALNNATRHANATAIDVELTARHGEVHLHIRDDGVGFDRQENEAMASGRSLGLIGMQERARLAGGALEIRSAPGSGTRVSAVFPT